MKKINNLFIIAFTLIILLIGAWIVRTIGIRFIVTMTSINIVQIFLRVISYINRILSLLLIIDLVIIFVVGYKQKYGKSIVAMSATNVILVVFIQIIKYGLAIYIQQIFYNKRNIPFGFNSKSMFVTSLSFVQLGATIILYLAIIIMLIISFNKVRRDNISTEIEG